MKNDDEINEFAAAALVKMSPELLRSFTSRAPKKGESRKLPTKIVGTHRTYSRKDLLSFDEYLRKPWPSRNGKRPHVPMQIQDEVRKESFFQCAICHSHSDTCEIAHIDPVASCKCNHPHNLIYLCANHHTKFDKQGVLGPVEKVRQDIASFKQTLLYVARVKWESHANSISECYSLAQLCQHLKKEIEAIGSEATADQLASYEKLADDTVRMLKASTVKGKQEFSNQKDTSTPGDLWAKLELSVQGPTLSAQLASAAALTLDNEFREAAGFVDCPLCEGAGQWEGNDCPECGGNCCMPSHAAERVDVSAYDKVDCPVCEGSGCNEDGDDCRACGGECQMTQGQRDSIGLSDY